MNEVAVIICNYNKKDYVLNCIKSVISQDFGSLDIFVVDNASADGSVTAIREQYENKVEIVENRENTGGAGGFNTGLRTVLRKGYQYVVLADNDVVMDQAAVGTLYEYLERNPEYGMCGGEILEADNPGIIQEMGGSYCLDRFEITSFFHGSHDSNELPEAVDCDFVSACTLMVRSAVLEKVGIMDEEYYLYMDDIDWCRRIKQAGFGIAAVSGAKIWHYKQAARSRPQSTFARYYLWRNKIYFFVRHVEKNSLEKLADVILLNTFNIIYGDLFKGIENEISSVMAAMRDALTNQRGKAQEGRILPLDYSDEPFRRIAESAEQFDILFSEEAGFTDKGRSYTALDTVLNAVFEINQSAHIRIIGENSSLRKARERCKAAVRYQSQLSFLEKSDNAAETTLKLYGHCNWVRENILPVIYVDERLNCVRNQEDFNFFLRYQEELEAFIRKQKPEFLKWAEGIRNE